MKTLTRQELVNKINSVTGTTFVTVETETIPSVKKGSPVLIKRSRVNGLIGGNYTNSVNYQRIREESEPNFVAAKRVWGENVNSFLVKLKDKFYLKLKVEKCETPEYFSNGVRIDNTVAQTFLSKKSESSRQELDKNVIIRNYTVDNIRKITMCGESYDIV